MFDWTSLHKSLSWADPLVAGGLQEVHFQTLYELLPLQKTVVETKNVGLTFFVQV